MEAVNDNEHDVMQLTIDQLLLSRHGKDLTELVDGGLEIGRFPSF
jgi:hypothetical protein